MSVTSAMFTGVSGLLANAEGINVIGNNLANVNTVGFKSGRMLFLICFRLILATTRRLAAALRFRKLTISLLRALLRAPKCH